MDERTLRNCRVLVAEDEYLVVEELQIELAQAGAAVLGPVALMTDALELVKMHPAPDVAILDVNLRGAMIFTAADVLVERGVPFFFTTGYDVGAIPQRFEHIPSYQKPPEMSEVVSAIARLIHS